MLAFTVTICPDEQSLSIACLFGYVVGNRFFVLFFSQPKSTVQVCKAYLSYRSLDRSFEKQRRCTRVPFAVVCVEIKTSKVAKDACHCHRTIAPWLAKCEVEFVVLHIWIARNGSLVSRELIYSCEERLFRLTVLMFPLERCWATALAIEGFSATHKILWGAIILQCSPQLHLSSSLQTEYKYPSRGDGGQLLLLESKC